MYLFDINITNFKQKKSQSSLPISFIFFNVGNVLKKVYHCYQYWKIWTEDFSSVIGMKSKGCSRFNNIYVSCNLLFKNGKKKNE